MSILRLIQGNLGLMHFSLVDMIKRLKEEYGTLLPCDLDQIVLRCTKIFKGGNLRISLLEIEAAYAELEAGGEGVSYGQKLRNLRESLRNSSEGMDVIEKWAEKYKSVKAQKCEHNFGVLITSLKQDYDKRHPNLPTDIITVHNRHVIHEVQLAQERPLSASDVSKMMSLQVLPKL